MRRFWSIFFAISILPCIARAESEYEQALTEYKMCASLAQADDIHYKSKQRYLTIRQRIAQEQKQKYQAWLDAPATVTNDKTFCNNIEYTCKANQTNSQCVHKDCWASEAQIMDNVEIERAAEKEYFQQKITAKCGPEPTPGTAKAPTNPPKAAEETARRNAQAGQNATQNKSEETGSEDDDDNKIHLTRAAPKPISEPVLAGTDEMACKTCLGVTYPKLITANLDYTRAIVIYGHLTRECKMCTNYQSAIADFIDEKYCTPNKTKFNLETKNCEKTAKQNKEKCDQPGYQIVDGKCKNMVGTDCTPHDPFATRGVYELSGKKLVCKITKCANDDYEIDEKRSSCEPRKDLLKGQDCLYSLEPKDAANVATAEWDLDKKGKLVCTVTKCTEPKYSINKNKCVDYSGKKCDPNDNEKDLYGLEYKIAADGVCRPVSCTNGHKPYNTTGNIVKCLTDDEIATRQGLDNDGGTDDAQGDDALTGTNGEPTTPTIKPDWFDKECPYGLPSEKPLKKPAEICNGASNIEHADQVIAGIDDTTCYVKTCTGPEWKPDTKTFTGYEVNGYFVPGDSRCNHLCVKNPEKCKTKNITVSNKCIKNDDAVPQDGKPCTAEDIGKIGAGNVAEVKTAIYKKNGNGLKCVITECNNATGGQAQIPNFDGTNCIIPGNCYPSSKTDPTYVENGTEYEIDQSDSQCRPTNCEHDMVYSKKQNKCVDSDDYDANEDKDDDEYFATAKQKFKNLCKNPPQNATKFVINLGDDDDNQCYATECENGYHLDQPEDAWQKGNFIDFAPTNTSKLCPTTDSCTQVPVATECVADDDTKEPESTQTPCKIDNAAETISGHDNKCYVKKCSTGFTETTPHDAWKNGEFVVLNENDPKCTEATPCTEKLTVYEKCEKTSADDQAELDKICKEKPKHATTVLAGTDGKCYVSACEGDWVLKKEQEAYKKGNRVALDKKDKLCSDGKCETIKIAAKCKCGCNDLQKAYDEAKERENSLANKTLGAVGMATVGIGGMMLAQGMAEKKADEDAELDMTAYLQTFRCEYGDGHSFQGGQSNIELPGGNALTTLYQEYKTLAADLKERKEALGLKPGLESKEILDKASIGLYDDVNTGKTGGAFTSIADALQGDDADAAAWAEQKEKSQKKLKTGAITAGAGIVATTAANLAINGNKDKKSDDDDDDDDDDAKCICAADDNKTSEKKKSDILEAAVEGAKKKGEKDKGEKQQKTKKQKDQKPAQKTKKTKGKNCTSLKC